MQVPGVHNSEWSKHESLAPKNEKVKKYFLHHNSLPKNVRRIVQVPLQNLYLYQVLQH
jgi:hypothetical protein